MKNLILFLLFPCYLTAQPLFPGFTGEALIDELSENYKTDYVLEYGPARDLMYGEIDLVNDSVRCVYTDHAIYLPPGVDPSSFLYMSNSSNGINAEHTYPRSKGATEDNGNPYSDLHHLFPTRSGVNTARNNHPFAEIPDNQTDKWYFKTDIENNIPSTNIDAYSELYNSQFEPREDHKGDVARAVFYFFTMYQTEALDADPDFFELQRPTLCNWHLADPVSSKEYNRTYKIAEYQDGLPNPFVIDCSAAIRCYCETLPTDCDDFVVATIAQVAEDQFKVYPNPVSSFLTVEAAGEHEILLTDNLGRQILQKSFRDKMSLDFSKLTTGFYILKLEEQVFKIVK